jgi:Ni/Fe-hydrogenase subunit HybB-like protein
MTTITLRPARGRIPLYAIWLGLLGAVMLAALGGAYLVFTRGLVVTGLTDAVPWGLWITMDLSSIALSAGAFSLSAAVYLLGLKELRPLARVAVFVGLIGYSMAMLNLLLDIGRPDRFWHSLVFWNTHSVLWEVTMCIMLYFSVLLVEFAPLVGEADWARRRFPRLAGLLRALHHAAPVLAVVGLGLSLLHQSSLGATYGVLKARPLWFKPDLSILFIVSAVAGGQSLAVLACLLVNRLRRGACVERAALERVAAFIGFTLLAYLYLKFWDTLAVTYTYAPGRTEGLWLLTQGPLQWHFWLFEIALGIVVPVVILLSPRRRADPRLLALATVLVVVGVIVNRWDVNLSGLMLQLAYVPGASAALAVAPYVPTWVEWLTAAGILAYGLAAFSLGARFLPVFATARAGGQEHA